MENPGAFDTEFGMSVAPGGDARHAQARLVEVGLGDALQQHGDGALVDIDRHAEGLGDRVGGDVVVGRADAAGGEDVGVAGAERVHRRDDLGLDVGHHAHLAEVDADIGQVLGDVADVLVLGAPGQDLVADDEDGGGDDAFLRCIGHAGSAYTSLAVGSSKGDIGRRCASPRPSPKAA